MGYSKKFFNTNISECFEISKIIFTFDYEPELNFECQFSFLINEYKRKYMREYVEDKDDKLNVQNELDYINYFKNKNKILIDSRKEIEKKLTPFFFDTVIFSKKESFF